jgi:hypothetical protein
MAWSSFCSVDPSSAPSSDIFDISERSALMGDLVPEPTPIFCFSADLFRTIFEGEILDLGMMCLLALLPSDTRHALL